MAIVETRSLSKAADLLHLTQSSISHRLKALEDEVDAQLIDRKRGHRFISLTPKGDDFINIAERWISLSKDISVWQSTDAYQLLDIGCVDSLNALVFPPFYKKLAECTPPISLKISTHWSFVIYNLLEAHEIDVGFVLREMNTRNILIEPVFRERMVLIHSSNGAKKHCSVHPNDLDHRKEVFLGWGPSYQIWHDKWWDPSKKPFTTVDTASLIISFIDGTDLWSIVPISMARTFEKIQSIQIVELLDPPPDRVCYKIMHRYPKPGRIKSIEAFNTFLEEFKNDEIFLSAIK